MPIITLTTDWGIKDHYVGSVKGALLKRCPEADIVDITHLISPFNILQAAFVLKNCYRDFAPESVHVVGVDSQQDSRNIHLALRYEDQYFIGADNGLFSLMLDKKPDRMVELSAAKELHSFSFATRDLYVNAACHLATGGNIGDLGEEKQSMVERILLRPVVEGDAIRGSVVYIDSYGNVVTNITRDLFDEVRNGRKFTLFLRRFDYSIQTLSNAYNQVPEGERLAMFNSTGHLEIALNKGKANALFGLHINDVIRIEFQ